MTDSDNPTYQVRINTRHNNMFVETGSSEEAERKAREYVDLCGLMGEQATADIYVVKTDCLPEYLTTITDWP